MDFVNGNIRKIYFRYLAAAFGSAMITSVYSIVDMAMVGQYQGPDGTASLAVVAPVWNVIYSLGLLMGIGGSVIFSIERGSSEKQSGSENQYFTAAVIGSVVSFVVMLTHYFQAILQSKVSFVVSVYVALNIRKYTKALPEL